MRINFSYLILIPFGILCSCKQEIKPEELKTWLKDKNNGWTAISDEGSFKFIVNAEPPIMKVLNGLKKENWTSEQVNSRIEEYNDLEYYVFTIQTNSEAPLMDLISPTRETYFENQYYMMDEIKNDMLLITQSDTLYPVMCHSERLYESTNYCTWDLAFKKGEPGERVFVYSDKLLGIDPVFLKLDIGSTLPTIKY